MTEVKIPGSLPWRLSSPEGLSIIAHNSNLIAEAYDYGHEIEQHDAAYIVHACNVYPALVEVLKLAEQFIVNGVETGRIYLPNEPDPALDTLPAIRSALKAAGVDP